ncbi:MAG TPA: CopG family transcriptional regulator [Vicinamibacterales bacterium]|nr:CopG family transcriptional regulator [Vicinamibacterales bacterium]
MQKTTVYLDPADYRALKRLAAKAKRPPAELVREAVAEYAARHETRRAPKSVGAFASGRRDLSERAEDLLKGMGRLR